MLPDRTKVFESLPALGRHARVELHRYATEIHPLQRMSKRLGISLDIKRDDTLPLAMGGNKVRQLEFYLGPASEQETDLVLITGAVQSNFVRLCAAAARSQGWDALVQLERRVANEDPLYNSSGNVLLNRMLGAEIVYFDSGEDEKAADASLDQLADEKRQSGRHPYVIHLGTDHPPLGGLGYVSGAVETWLQCEATGRFYDHVVMGSGSGLTHAGFLVGARAMGWQVPVHGMCVRRDGKQQQARIEQRAREVADLLGAGTTISDDDIRVDDRMFAPGYGQLNPQVIAAVQLAAEHEAILLDPVYTGKAMAGLINLVEQGDIKQGESVLFIHTGGTPALFAYQSTMKDAVLT